MAQETQQYFPKMAQQPALPVGMQNEDMLTQQYQLQNNQRLAQLLMQQGAEQPQGQAVSGHYVAPSVTQNIANLLKTYVGGEIAKNLPKQQAAMSTAQQNQYAKMLNLGPNGQPAAQAPAAQPGVAQAMPVGDGQQQQAPQQSAIPPLPGKSARESLPFLSSLGTGEYMKLVAAQGAPTDLAKTLISAGVQPGSPQWQQAMSANVTKTNDLPPTVVSPGASVLPRNASAPTYTAAKDGIQMRPDGTAAEVPGFAGANANIQGAETAATEGAKANLDLVPVPDGRGGSIQMPRSKAAALLSGAGQQGAVSQPAAAPGAIPPGQLGQTPSPTALAAQQALPKVTGQIDQMMKTIDDVKNQPGLPYSVGMYAMAPTIAGTKQSDFRTALDQLKGQVFLQAYESLRGAGAITEPEGAKAEAAIARLNPTQRESTFRANLEELKGVLDAAKKRAYGQAGLPVPDTTPTSPTTAPSVDLNAYAAEARRRGLLK